MEETLQLSELAKSPLQTISPSLSKFTDGENILVSAQRFNAIGNSNNNKNACHLLSFLCAKHCAKCFTFTSFTCHNNPTATRQGHNMVKWLDWDFTPGHLHSKLRHFRATQCCFARINTPNEDNALRIRQVPTIFNGTGGKVGYTERDKMVAVFKDITIQLEKPMCNMWKKIYGMMRN